MWVKFEDGVFFNFEDFNTIKERLREEEKNNVERDDKW